MEKYRNEALHTNEQNLKEEISFDESVCSAEFPEGCTLPVSEQPGQPE